MKRGCNPATLPDSFATPENVTMGEELSMIESVVTTVGCLFFHQVVITFLKFCLANFAQYIFK